MPRLEGLLLEGCPGRAWTLYPWLRVVRSTDNYWWMFDEQGARIRHDGWTSRCCNAQNRRATLIGQRAQERAFRRAWDTGQFEITEKLDDPRKLAWRMLAVGVLFALGAGFFFLIPFTNGLLQEAKRLPFSPPFRDLLTILFFVCAVPGLALSWRYVAYNVRLFRAPRIVRARADGSGFAATLQDGRQVKLGWLHYPHIQDYLIQPLAPHNRLRLMLRIVGERIMPARPARYRLARFWQGCRIASYSLMMGLMALYFSRLVKEVMPSSGVAAIGTFWVVCGTAMITTVAFVVLLRPASAYRPRKRRALRRR